MDAAAGLARVRAVTVRLPHNLRSDTLDNRERILDAARAAFAVEGLNVSMREIARRTGVGPATLYRHFPTKQLLATEAFTDQLCACRVIIDEGLVDPDPWHGFCLVIEKVCELHACNRGFAAAFTSAYPNAMDVTAGREYALNSVAELAHHAKEAGHLRPDFVLDDLILMIMAAALIREVREETGAEPQIMGLLEVLADEYQQQHFSSEPNRSSRELANQVGVTAAVVCDHERELLSMSIGNPSGPSTRPSYSFWWFTAPPSAKATTRHRSSTRCHRLPDPASFSLGPQGSG